MDTPARSAHDTDLPRDLDVIPLRPTFAGRVEGLDLNTVDDATIAAIGRAMDKYAVLVFPGQTFTDEQQFHFGGRFGPIESVPTTVDQERARLKIKEMNDITNVGLDGKLLPANDRRRMYNLGNMLWHSDSSFKQISARYSMLHARVVPPEGGETEYADMRAAWDDLPVRLKRRAYDLVCEHSVIYSRNKLGFDSFTPEEIERSKPVLQRLVRRHEASHRVSLFLSAHIGRIGGMEVPEALVFVNELIEFATQRHYVYQHKWAVGDLVIWDNRSTMHRGRSYEENKYPRELRRVTVAGTVSSFDVPVPPLQEMIDA